MGMLIEELWMRQDCRTSMLAETKTESFLVITIFLAISKI